MRHSACRPGTLLPCDAAKLAPRLLRRRLLPVRTLTPQRLVRRRRWGRTAPVAVVKVVFHVLLQLLEEEGALEPHLGDASVQPFDAEARAVVVLFDVVDAAPQLDAFAVVGCLDRRWEVLLRKGALATCWK